MTRNMLRVLLILISLLYIETEEERNFFMDVTNTTCAKFGKQLRFIECESFKFCSSHYGISVRTIFTRDMGRTLSGRVLMKGTLRKSNRTITILDIRIHACSALKQMTSNMFVKRILIAFKKTNNLPTNCPLKANVLYRMDNFSVSDTYIPTFWPLFNFTYTVELYDRSYLFAMWEVSGGLVPKS
ncbi:uncharacterized protein LOC131997082 [Stomoxys calcitrans]|uniref:uncharacterized protein LOC131997082 n=1 Tax=Stomoxys calcitrans TaxID=35570 RepID=UPI0027E2CC38|nr:uncharacterized protein LOC131997082 [Stomoxys calcitrans]